MTAQTKWAYSLMSGPRQPTPEELNAAGDDGWELVSAYATAHHMGQTNKHVFVFKRALAPETPNPATPLVVGEGK